MSTSELTSTGDGTDEGAIETGAGASRDGDDVADGSRGRQPTDDGGSAGTVDVAKDVVFDILKNERRRQALHFLREHPTTDLSDLAEHVAALENDKPIRDLTSSERKRVYVGLYQCHLPKMDDAGVIDYNRSRGTIELLEASSLCFLYLDVDRTARSDDERGGQLSGVLAPLASLLGLR